MFCAEPSPDVADNLASSFASALEGSDGTVTAKVELAKSFASSAKQLFKRSQGVQLYRDGMYSLCQNFINGAINKMELKQMQNDLLTESSKLIDKEIPFLQNSTDDTVQTPDAPVTKMSGCSDGKPPAGNPPVCSDGKPRQ